MANSISSDDPATVGMDLGDRISDVCGLTASAEVLFEKRVLTNPSAMETFFAALTPTRVVIEVGAHSRWIRALLHRLAHQVIVADARRVGLVAKGSSKTDKKDARLLALLGMGVPHLLGSVHHRSEATQAELAQLKSRDTLIQERTRLINRIRGLVKAFGSRLPSISARAFHRKGWDLIPVMLQAACKPLFDQLRFLDLNLRRLDKQIEKLAERHGETQLFQTVKGVGPITSLAFSLILEDPRRFAKSREVGPYVGLNPQQRESGKCKPQLGISKSGNRYLRRLLVQCAHYILSSRNKVDSDLRRWGLEYCRRGGKNAKKRAVTAVARKLAIILHRMWVSGEPYRPLRHESKSSRGSLAEVA